MPPSPAATPPPQQKQQSSPVSSTGVTSLYVGDLHPETTEEDLEKVFKEMGVISSIRLCRCTITKKSLCYGYVNFSSHEHARKAMACLNYADLKGKPMRIMWTQRDPLARKSGVGNLFVKNLHPCINGTFLLGLFCPHGNILSCKVAEEGGVSKGYGFVQFDSEDSALAARTALHDTLVLGKKLHVDKFCKKDLRTNASELMAFTNLYVKNLAKDVTEDSLREMFSKFGEVCDVVIKKDVTGKSKGFGFVKFKSPADAKKAVEDLNGTPQGSKNLFVGRAQSRAERAELLRCQYKEKYNVYNDKTSSNLYVKNLDASVDDKKLQELFGCFGKITSAKVMCNETGISKGFGFVCFSTPEEANKAMLALHGAMFQGKQLYVSVAQRKEDRMKLLLNPPMKFPVVSPNNSFSSAQKTSIYFPYGSYCSQLPPLHQQMLYHYGASNGSMGYYYGMDNYLQNYNSYVPAKQTLFGASTGKINNGANQQRLMTHSTTPNAFNKGLNQVNFRALKSNHLEGYERVAAAPPLATAAIADKLKPDSPSNGRGMILNFTGMKMINQVLRKETNGRTTTNAGNAASAGTGVYAPSLPVT